MVLGALYDSFEKLQWKLLSANPDAGILMASERKTGMLFLIRVCPDQGEQVITVELATGIFSSRDSPEKEAAGLLETLTQIIEDALKRNPPRTRRMHHNQRQPRTEQSSLIIKEDKR
ncbi:MAG: hypothetical protein HPY50_18395 [Firmicutes bacterium]|nr:hypothetical protein [Bacillota bacterium]